MPSYKLTNAEKADLRRKYLQNVEILNRYLPEGKKIRPDLKALNTRLNDVSEQRFYKKATEINRNNKMKLSIARDISNKVKETELETKSLPLERSIHTKMLPSYDEKRMKYNRYIIEQYHEHPEAMVQEKYQKLLAFNPGDLGKIAEAKDTKNCLLDFYEQNEEAIDDGFQMNKVLGGMKDKLNPFLANHLEAISGNFETMIIAGQAVKLAKNDTYFTLPELDEETVELLDNSDFSVDHEELYRNMIDKKKDKETYETGLQDFKKTMKGYKDAGVNLNEPGIFTRLIATVEKNGKSSVVSPAEYFSGLPSAQGDSFSLQSFKKEALENISHVFKKDYAKEANFKLKEIPSRLKTITRGELFRKDFAYMHALNNNLEISKVDASNLGDIAANIKGNLKEQIFGTTSTEYKDFIRKMKGFENPKSDFYNDGKSVYKAGNTYLQHKGVHSLEDIEKLPQPSKDRAKLCWEVMDAYEEHMSPTDERYYRGTDHQYSLEKRSPEQKKQAIFDPKEVSDDPLGKIVIKEAPANIKDKDNKITVNDAKDFIEDDADELSDMLNGLKDPKL